MSISSKDIVNEGYTHLFDLGYWDYSWDITVFFAKDGRVFGLNDAGCSCYGWGDGWRDVHEAIGDMHQYTSLYSIRLEFDYTDPDYELLTDDKLALLRQHGVW